MKTVLATLVALLSLSAFAADSAVSNQGTPASNPPATKSSKVVVHKAKKKSGKSKNNTAKKSDVAPATPVSQ
jgi:hypothetical protein